VPFHDVLTQVKASKAFELTTVSITPGDTNFSKWLSQVAVAYEEFWIRQLSFTFVSQANYNMNVLETGLIVMSLDYDCTDAAPTNLLDMQRTAKSNCKAFKPQAASGQKLIFKPSNCQKKRYFTLAPNELIPNDDDIHNYIPANFYLAVEGTPISSDGVIIGQVEIDAIIELKVPKYDQLTATTLVSSVYGAADSIDQTNYLGNAWELQFGDPSPYFSLDVGPPPKIVVDTTIPAGSCVFVFIEWFFSTGSNLFNLDSITAAQGVIPSIYPGGTGITDFNDPFALGPQNSLTGTGRAVISFVYQAPADGLTVNDEISINFTSFPSSPSNIGIYFTPWSSSALPDFDRAARYRPKRIISKLDKKVDVLEKKIASLLLVVEKLGLSSVLESHSEFE